MRYLVKVTPEAAIRIIIASIMPGHLWKIGTDYYQAMIRLLERHHYIAIIEMIYGAYLPDPENHPLRMEYGWRPDIRRSTQTAIEVSNLLHTAQPNTSHDFVVRLSNEDGRWIEFFFKKEHRYSEDSQITIEFEIPSMKPDWIIRVITKQLENWRVWKNTPKDGEPAPKIYNLLSEEAATVIAELESSGLYNNWQRQVQFPIMGMSRQLFYTTNDAERDTLQQQLDKCLINARQEIVEVRENIKQLIASGHLPADLMANKD